jgi:hypothetical protein
VSSGVVHRRISRTIAAPTAVAIGLLTHDWFGAAVVGVACALSGCGPDDDQVEAHLPLAWKVAGGAAWVVFGAWMVWGLKDAPLPPPSP